MLTYNHRAAEVMEHLCTHDGDAPGHGYSQYSRWGDGTVERLALSDGTQVTVAGGDRDCSAATIDAWETACPGSTAGATYTGNMKTELLSTGLWEWHPMGDGYIAQRGDIYLNEAHHAAMCLSAEPDMLAQFSISERGTIDGREGDQTGWESNIKPYYNYPWDGKLVYVGPQPQAQGGQAAQPADDIDALARAVINGEYGNGEDRRRILGDRYDEVQARVNAILSGAEPPKTVDELAREVIDGRWGNGAERKQRLRDAGYDALAVQRRVNELLG